MTTLMLASLLQVLSAHLTLSHLSIKQLNRFVNLAQSLKWDILLVQPAGQPENEPPDNLSISIERFLADACSLSHEQVTILWTIMQLSVWYDQPTENYALFLQHGPVHVPDALFPPQHTCKNGHCLCALKGQLLMKAEQWQAILYTLDRGPIITKHVHLQCEHYKITYELNFYVEGAHRYYYDTMPDIIQVSNHIFIEKRVIDLFDNLANLSWTLFTNCTHLYNTTFSHKIDMPTFADNPISRFVVRLTQQNIWNGFVIKALLLDCLQCQSTLIVPKGEQKDQFTEAIWDHNLRI
ncbi:hypothetical protein HD554DRAFT_2192833 [Boletus coccyginus]|nr:hypothetical protein HD554DRAFT_2192833 [Boletus coccyginus]